ncbi:MAG: hypothetical protein ACOCQX_00540 [Candidatus Nanoarchaeia archaeon]
MDFFSSPAYLEPKCKHCKSKIEYGKNTVWSEELETTICTECNNPLELLEENKELEFENAVL